MSDQQSVTPAGPGPARLDQALVARGLAPTRAQAADLVRRGLVRVAGRPAHKAGQRIAADDPIEIDPAHVPAVSRAGAKLAAALDALGLDPAGRVALDVGASTGGFTQVLLARGAIRVHAVDVGHGQLHAALRSDARVVVREGLDARALTAELIGEQATAVVVDVSFISLAKVLPAVLAMAAPGCWLVALVKPQFEVGPGRVGKGGIVRDETLRAEAVAGVAAAIAGVAGWRIVGTVPSPVAGKDGNRETLIGACRDD